MPFLERKFLSLRVKFKNDAITIESIFLKLTEIE